jgi:hypothetical protein
MEDPKKRKDDPPKGSKRFDTTRCPQKGYPTEVKGILRAWLLVALIAVLVGVSVWPNNATAQATYSEDVGTLPRGTPYRIRVPTKWNGTLINDLDFANGADADSIYTYSTAVMLCQARHGVLIDQRITILPTRFTIWLPCSIFSKPNSVSRVEPSNMDTPEAVTSRSGWRRFTLIESMEQSQGARIPQFGS